MAKQSIIPFGPQHPVLPEPIHLDLVMEDEKVVAAIPSIGYIHRGLEKLVEKREYQDMMFVSERICGICSYIHGAGFCQAVENMMEIQLPDRARYLRTFWSELSRVHSHILWLGLLADAFGFESLFMHSWRLRESILDIYEETTGGRVIFSVNKIGGVRKDISREQFDRFDRVIAGMNKEVTELTNVFLNDYTVKSRTVGVGNLTKEQAYELAAVGPTMRASGIAKDHRVRGYMAYPDLDWEICTATGGDCYARTEVRINEVFQSFDLLRQVIQKIPDGEIETKVTGNPDGENFELIEQPRGEVVYYVKGDGSKYLERFRVRTPTFANVPPLLKMLEGADLADVPVIVLSIDPCISCTER